MLFIGLYLFMFRFALTESEKYNLGEKHVQGVVDGWFMGRKMDLSDGQWNTWRNNLPVLILGMAIFLLVSDLVKRSGNTWKRVLYCNVASLCFLFILHGVAAFWVLVIALINFAITRLLGHTRVLPFAVWAFNASVLWTSYFSHGYHFEELLGPDYSWLDQKRGLIAWEGYFKISMLRFISYGMDYYWMTTARPVTIKNPKEKDPYFLAQERHLPRGQYDWWHYFAYIFYVPLYIAGPIISFNAWCCQMYNGPQSTDMEPLTRQRVWKAIGRLVVIYIGFEIWLHYCYLYAINERGVWKEFKSFAVCITAYFVLNFMYTKFLIIWRFFRVVSMFDGIDVPENMNRCVNNNFTFTGFWRSWHASFNKWTVRYLYIPLGGRKTQTITIWVIFLFIGLWHDLWISWVAWALLNCVFFSIEILIMVFFNRPQMLWFTSKPYWHNIVMFAGGINVFLLMIANLAILHGFTNSVLFLQNAFVHENGVVTFLVSWLMVSVPVLYMMEIRAGETRRNEARRF
jgi:D-alanyl-lipoteichoic acid acyltransferase DltB (MBOAT superfamily)